MGLLDTEQTTSKIKYLPQNKRHQNLFVLMRMKKNEQLLNSSLGDKNYS